MLEDMEAPPPLMPAQPAERPTSGLALASVICGPLGFLTAGLSGIAAVITGHMALSAIKRSGGMLKGTGMAITGLVTGYLTMLILPAILAGLAAPVIMKQRQAADRTVMMNNAKMLHLAMMSFDADYGTFPSDKLVADEPAFAGLTGPRVLEQLEAADSSTDLNRLLATNKGSVEKWYYFPGQTTSSPAANLLLLSPQVGDKIVVVQVDGSAKAVNATTLSSLDRSGAVEIPATKKKR
jgi:type II secretory pathway pseudopilin PulG